jgi:hypothetical protein
MEGTRPVASSCALALESSEPVLTNSVFVFDRFVRGFEHEFEIEECGRCRPAAGQSGVTGNSDAWVTEIHTYGGYLAGVYANPADTRADIANANVAQSDAIWIAKYNGPRTSRLGILELRTSYGRTTGACSSSCRIRI